MATEYTEHTEVGNGCCLVIQDLLRYPGFALRTLAFNKMTTFFVSSVAKGLQIIASFPFVHFVCFVVQALFTSACSVYSVAISFDLYRFTTAVRLC